MRQSWVMYTISRSRSSSKKATRVVVPFVYHALVHARKCMATSATVTVVPMGADAGGEGGKAPSGAICGQRSCVNWGGKNKNWPELSNPPCTNAICACLRGGIRECAGLHQYYLVDDEVLPGAKEQQLQNRLWARVMHTTSVNNIKCVVVNENTYFNESHVLDAGAGMAAFLRPTPPYRHAYVIPQGTRICLYSNELVNEAEQVNTDYLLVCEAYGRKAWNPLVPNDANYGRLVNLGGLEEGLKALVASCDVLRGFVRYSAGDAENVFMAACNVTYKYTYNHDATEGRKQQLEVMASKTIHSSSTHAIELLGNYGIGYWIPYVLSHHDQWGMDNAIVKCVLWLLLSENSSMGRAELLQYLGGRGTLSGDSGHQRSVSKNGVPLSH